MMVKLDWTKNFNLNNSFATNLHSFALLFFHTLNLDVRLEPSESLFPGLQFGHKNDLKRSPDGRVTHV